MKPRDDNNREQAPECRRYDLARPHLGQAHRPDAGATRVVVVGGGLAGMAASVALAGAGFEVDLLERRAFLGGRATSYEVPAAQEVRAGGTPADPTLTGYPSGWRAGRPRSQLETIDNCQHVLLGCCTNLLDFYERLKVRDRIRFYDEICFVTPGGQTSVMRRDGRPAPLHLLASLRRFHALSWRDKLSIVAALGACSIEFGMISRTELDSETMMSWLGRHKQTAGAIEYFWRVVLTSTLNEDLEHVSAWHGLQVMWKGFLAHREAYRVGLSTVPLAELYRLDIPGVCVHPLTSVRSLAERNSRVAAARTSEGNSFSGAYFVLALPFESTAELLPGDYSAFSHSPIIGIHLWFDRPLFERPFAALLGRTMQWAFRKPGASPSQDAGYVQCVVSAARNLASVSRNEIIHTAVRELSEFFPGHSAALLKATVVKELRATFSASTGIESARPPAVTHFPNCFLAGDWTNNGWPPTMEAAVRSGYRAAELIAAQAGRPQRFVLPELKPEGLSRWAPAARWDR